MINLGRFALAREPGATISTRAIDLVAESTVVDMLGFLTMDWEKLFSWFREPPRFDDDAFRRLESTGIDIYHPGVDTAGADPFEGVRFWIDGWRSLLRDHTCSLRRIDGLADVLRVPDKPEIGVLVGFQNSNHFRTVDDVELFHHLGQRISQLTYDEDNRLGSGCRASRDRGLTSFGAEIVAAMNRVGMVVDVSHCGERTSREAIAVSRDPVLATHANCKALVPHQPRNKSDETIRLLAAGGGVIGINLVRAYVGVGSPSIETVLDHFDHVVDVAGVEHVGLGSDLSSDAVDPVSGRVRAPYAIRGLHLPSRAFQLTEGLVRRGYTDREIELILGGNFVRVLAEVWSDQWDHVAEAEPSRDPFCPASAPVSPPPIDQ